VAGQSAQLQLWRSFLWSSLFTRQGVNANEISRNVTTIIVHTSYDRNTNNNDIALLRLSSAVTFNNYIRPVCLAAQNSVFPSGTSSWITGWGDVQSGVSLPDPGILQETMVPVVDNDQCNTLLGSGSVTSNMMCAGLMEGGKDTCQGDSGGPMVSKQCSVWVQSGITSWGYGCADPNAPGVYTRVSQYQSWITNNIGQNLPGFVTFSPTSTCQSVSPTSTTSPTTTKTTTTPKTSTTLRTATTTLSPNQGNSFSYFTVHTCTNILKRLVHPKMKTLSSLTPPSCHSKPEGVYFFSKKRCLEECCYLNIFCYH
uniref:Tryptase-like n=1 Tax=Sinocyclocheilus rhinocerous TaxID=307959 RepID=A0A673I016_9TELE